MKQGLAYTSHMYSKQFIPTYLKTQVYPYDHVMAAILSGLERELTSFLFVNCCMLMILLYVLHPQNIYNPC